VINERNIGWTYYEAGFMDNKIVYSILLGKLKERDALENVDVDRGIILKKKDLEEIEWRWCWSDSSVSG